MTKTTSFIVILIFFQAILLLMRVPVDTAPFKTFEYYFQIFLCEFHLNKLEFHLRGHNGKNIVVKQDTNFILFC